MRWRLTELALWTLGACLVTLLINLAQISALTGTVASGTPVVPQTPNIWPWLALAGIVLLLVAISLFAQRRLPFGGRP